MKRLAANINLTTLSGFFAVTLGLFYIVNVPQMTNDAISSTTIWGLVAMSTGIFTAFLTIKRTGWIFSCILLSFIILLQVPPIALWFIFNGTIVGEPGTPSAPIGHWAWAVPHTFLAVLSIKAIFDWKRKQISG